MEEYLKKLPQELKFIISQVAKVSEETRMPAYLVGGCLRDLILKVKNLDLDIVIEGKGIIFAQILAQRLKVDLKTYQRFGTASLIFADGLKVDIATTRQEKYLCSAALPVVSAGSLNDDLKRRDFTINSLAISLALDKPQEIIDPYGGQKDLNLGRICILHDASFEDDPTRIFRAVRFSQRFNFKIDPKTLLLLKEAIASGALESVNPHRIRNELILILKEQDPFGSLKRLGDLGALSIINAKLKIGKSTQVLFKSIAKEIDGFVKKLPSPRQLDTWLIYFAALLEPLTLAQIKLIIDRFGLTKGDRLRLISYRQWQSKLRRSLSKKQVSPERICALLEPLSYEAIILLSATTLNKNFKKHLKIFFADYKGIRLSVSGDDLVSLGVAPGPEYKKIFAKVLAAKLNGQVKNRQTELALIKRLVKTK